MLQVPIAEVFTGHGDRRQTREAECCDAQRERQPWQRADPPSSRYDDDRAGDNDETGEAPRVEVELELPDGRSPDGSAERREDTQQLLHAEREFSHWIVHQVQ